MFPPAGGVAQARIGPIIQGMAGVVPKTYLPLPPPHDHEAAAREFERLKETAPDLAALAEREARVHNLLAAVFGASPFLARIIHAEPAFATACFREDPEALFARLLEETAAAPKGGEAREAELMAALRLIRRRMALLVALADLAGFWPVMEVTARLTRFADAAVQAAVAFALAQAHARGRLRHADPATSGYVVLAMGKMGAFELNYSSDIDLVVFYDPQKAPVAEGVEPGPLFVRITRQVVKILSEITGEGLVFRTDLRLRPDPGSTQVAMSVEAALSYYYAMGQNWERAAMIKARPCAGDLAVGEAFLAELSPWIWRKYLDFAAIADVQALKRQIHAVKGHGEIAVAGHNIKLGRGGIREIEFFVQTQQLIAGGRNPALRGRETLRMLHALAEHGWITEAVAEELDAAYRFLRRLEHRIQMVNDQQTHQLPTEPEALERLARFAGFADRAHMDAEVRKVLRTVQRHYAALFEEAPELAAEAGSLVFTGGEDDPETVETLRRMGFSRPEAASAIIRGWHYGRYRAMRSERARERLTEITPALLQALVRAGDPDAGLAAFDRFLAGLPSGVQLFSLLKANPHLLDLLVMILGTAPLLAEELSRRPRLFDIVLDADFLDPFPDRAGYDALIAQAVPEDLSFEEALDHARLFAGEQRFRIGVRLIAETATPEEASAAYTALAEAVIARMLRLVWREMAATYGEVPGGRVAVIAMGKLGGEEMTATSDLDLILVYDHDPDATASEGGRRALAPGAWFTRLTQRLVTALSSPTAHGILYEVDMRLRPSGSQGPVATHLESFRRYHEESAWTWEHLALTRARVIAGDAALSRTVAGIIRDTLTRPRDAEKVRADALDMRRRILKEKPPRTIWDIKLARGGLIDIEFVAQTMQLIHAPARPEVLHQNTGAALEGLAAAGLLSGEEAETLLAAWRLDQHLMHILRLCVREGFDGRDAPEGLVRLIANATASADLSGAAARLAETQQNVAAIFERHVGKVGE